MDMVTWAVIGIIGYVFAILGLVAFVRLGKLTKTLKEKAILEEDYKEGSCTKQIYSVD